MAVTPDSCLAADGGDDRVWPPGFRFHPTDEELVLYYLKRKICRRRLKLDIIRELDVYKWDPEELPGQSLLKTGDRQWFFFSPRDRKYPNGARSNRATRQGYWKTTGKDRSVTCNSRNVGVKKTLVFYRGRAPNGERTDWVMHEYTMDEDELKRCSNVHDYYALYKVFKKSGPGPKNGEQYGALFKEEDWPDDEHADLSNYVTPVKKQSAVIPPLENTKAVARVEQPLNDLDNFIKQLTSENLNGQTQIGGYPNGLPQVAVDEDTQSTLFDLSPASSQQFGMQVSLDFNQSGTSTLQSPGAPEVKSIPNNSDPVSQFCEEDFLEMDDLLGPEPTFSKTDKLMENLGFDNFDGLSELDLYHDAALFFHEMGSIVQESALQINDTGFQLQHNANTNQVNYQLQPHSGVGDVNYQLQPHSGVGDANYQLQPHSGVGDANYQLQTHSGVGDVNYQLQPHSGVDGVNYQLQPHSGVEGVNYQLHPHSGFDGVNYQLQPHSGVEDVNYLQPEPFGSDQLWVHDQRSNDVCTPTESINGTISHETSGVVNESSSNPTIANENQTGGEDQDCSSWFSSALWSFVESIPTTPASAAESPLVNKAFERMSSFSRLRMNVKSYNKNDVDDTNARNRPANARIAGRNRGFLFLSVFGALCAILWVLVGSIRMLKRTVT